VLHKIGNCRYAFYYYRLAAWCWIHPNSMLLWKVKTTVLVSWITEMQPKRWSVYTVSGFIMFHTSAVWLAYTFFIWHSSLSITLYMHHRFLHQKSVNLHLRFDHVAKGHVGLPLPCCSINWKWYVYFYGFTCCFHSHSARSFLFYFPFWNEIKSCISTSNCIQNG